MKSKFLLLEVTVSFIFFTFLIYFAWAQEQAAQPQNAEITVQPQEADEVVMKTVTGEVSAINSRGVAVVYDRNFDTGTEYEIYIPIDKNTVLKHKTSIKDIKAGDLISVNYAQPKKGSALAKVIDFIQSSVTSSLVSSAESHPAAKQQSATANETQ